MKHILLVIGATALLALFFAETASAQPAPTLTLLPGIKTLSDVTGLGLAVGVQTEAIPALKGRISVDALKAAAEAKLKAAGLTVSPTLIPVSALVIEVNIVDSGKDLYAMSVIASYSRYLWVPESANKVALPKYWTTA